MFEEGKIHRVVVRCRSLRVSIYRQLIRITDNAYARQSRVLRLGRVFNAVEKNENVQVRNLRLFIYDDIFV